MPPAASVPSVVQCVRAWRAAQSATVASSLRSSTFSSRTAAIPETTAPTSAARAGVTAAAWQNLHEAFGTCGMRE